MQKFMKTSDELIQHMKNKGIKFNIINEIEAKEILENRNYYLKLASYRNNYSKNDKNEYIDLEFAYLKELSSIDMKLRYLILQMALDIEHSIKVILLDDIVKNNKIYEYKIVDDFRNNFPNSYSQIFNKLQNSYCGDLINKHQSNIPIWVLVEVISFGDIVKLYKLYCNNYNNLKYSKLLYSVRDIRNAAAHSNCLIYKLEKGSHIIASQEIINYLVRLNVSKIIRKNKLSNKFFSDFTTLLYTYKIFVKSQKLKERRKKELVEIFYKRILKNKEYFIKNNTLVSGYNFCKILVDDF